MKFLVIIVTVLISMGSSNSLSYPIFGTKRYHRGGSPRTGMTQHILRQPVYEDGYVTSNGYYYYPHHEYHSYGMPTYRGEYKPKAYYYSAGPSYNYYNDREPVSNPLDDLHEEILQENEQERQSDMLGDDDYEEEYYIEPNDSPRDAYTNNFLRNMIDYNRQKEKLQRLQQLHQQQREQIHEDIEEEEERPEDEDYFSEIDVNPDDFQFEPKGEDNFDLQKYWDAEMSSLSNGANANTAQHQRDRESPNMQINDADVEQLKSLTKSTSSKDDETKKYHGKVKLGQQYPYLNSWRQEQTSESNPPKPKENEDDYSALDYDDESWINWERKRSSIPKTQQALNSDKPSSDYKIRKRLFAGFKKDQLSSRTNADSKPTLRSTMSPASISVARGQKEKFPTEGILTKPRGLPPVTETEDSENSVNEESKTTNDVEQSIYDTIKQMISIKQELKKNGSTKRKRFVSNEASLVNQLDNLRRAQN